MKQVDLKKLEFEYRRKSRLTALYRISGPSSLYSTDGKWQFPAEKTNRSGKLQTETLNIEVKSIVLEKHEFENQDELMLKVFLAVFLTIKTPKQERS